MRDPWGAAPQGIVRYRATFAQFPSHVHGEYVNIKLSAIESFIPNRLDLSRFAQEASSRGVVSETRPELRITHTKGGSGGGDITEPKE